MGRKGKRVGRVESLNQLLGRSWGRGEGMGEPPSLPPTAEVTVSTLERHDPWAFVRRALQGGKGAGGRYRKREEGGRKGGKEGGKEEVKKKSQSMVNLVQ